MSNRAFGRTVAAVLLVSASLVGGLTESGGAFRPPAVRAGGGDAAQVEQAYTEALEVVAKNYVDEVDYEKASQASIQGMLSALDPHSNFFTKNDYLRLLQDQESRFTGIGVTILRHRDGVYVQSPVEGTPAAKAGMRFGDRIVEVDGKDAREWSTLEVSKAVRGPEGERVTLKVERAGAQAPLYFTIVRASVPQPSIRNAFMIRPGTGYVGMTGTFTHTTSGELRTALERLGKEGMRQLVLDLRNNPGGLLDQAINVASQFLPRGRVVVSVRGRDGDRTRDLKNTGFDPVEYPLVVLINRNSASASEIVAGAIQDHGRGLVVGETSFGKGLVQRVFTLPYGAGLTLTTAKYYTPYGRLIQRDYSHSSFYDYYTRNSAADEPRPAQPLRPTNPTQPNAGLQVQPSPTPQPPPTGPPVRTAAGRVFYGGGGITPDHEVKPLDVATPARGRIFEASFYFTRQLVAGLVPGLEAYRVEGAPQLGRYPRPTDLPVNDRLLEAFREFVRRERALLGLGVGQVNADLDYVRLRLRDDIATAAYGSDAGNRTLLEGDPQLLRSLELFPEARSLAENVSRAGAGGNQ